MQIILKMEFLFRVVRVRNDVALYRCLSVINFNNFSNLLLLIFNTVIS